MMKPLDRLDALTLHGLVRAFMSANYEDAIDAKAACADGLGWNPEVTRGKELERSICTLSQCIEQSMNKGELTPFSGDYVSWMENLGLISPRKKVTNEEK